MLPRIVLLAVFLISPGPEVLFYYSGGVPAGKPPAGTDLAMLTCTVMLNEQAKSDLKEYVRTHKTAEQSYDFPKFAGKLAEKSTSCQIVY